ncbi:MAG: class I SAM-dependent methyltransferase [Alphaproteobacteria bacterium]|nr:class I SAM-dependent methyltransferase [Alphaproteobacteria bacterium]MDP7229928.1 class I SAM-dependent methyltransferase [Alphaproteobacteria bacterium]HJO89548.1 class I SAM-dependent methyltransferase [Alphaproteobacteria bacterium]
MPGKLRLSLKPSKQLLWLWLWREMRASRGRALGIDAGCGLMQNRMLFETADYVGIDVDGERLEANQKRFPGVRTVCAEIEHAVDMQGDVVLCVQVTHNRFFAVDRTVPTIAAMAAILRPDGMLIFNLGERNISFEGEIDALLQAKFAVVKKRRYGAFSTSETYLSPLLAVLMYLLPPLRWLGGARKVLYVCHGAN